MATLFEAGITDLYDACALSTDNIFIIYKDLSDSSKGKFTIYQPTGTLVKAPTVFDSGSTLLSSSCVKMGNDNIVVAYPDTADSNKGKFVIYQPDGTVDVAATQFEAGAAFTPKVVALNNGNFFIAYEDVGVDGKFVIYDNTGVLVAGPTQFEAGDNTIYKAVTLANNNVIIFFYMLVLDHKRKMDLDLYEKGKRFFLRVQVV